MKKRRKSRILALHCLYQFDLLEGDINTIFDTTKENFRLKDKLEEFSLKLVLTTVKNWEELGKIIDHNSKNWSLNRMCTIDRVLIKMGCAELLYFDELPVSVTINEMVEIAKAYSTDNSAGFVNAVLDNIATKLVPDKER